MSRTILINKDAEWSLGLYEFIRYRGKIYPLTYINNCEFTCSNEIPQDIIEEIKKRIEGS
jgi:hypothetical protein